MYTWMKMHGMYMYVCVILFELEISHKNAIYSDASHLVGF